jgi:hypothetical protein
MNRKLTTGYYTPTLTFASICEHIAVMDADDNTLVALVGAAQDTPENLAESKETARLFAAAPELLDALQGLFDNCSMIHKHWGEDDNSKQANAAILAARAAICKARGL